MWQFGCVPTNPLADALGYDNSFIFPTIHGLEFRIAQLPNALQLCENLPTPNPQPPTDRY